MLMESDLHDLSCFVASARMLSVYLNTDTSSSTSESHKLHLRNLFKNLAMPLDVEAVNRFIQYEYDWTAKGLAIFSAAGQGYFKSITLSMPVRNAVFVGDRPSLKQLADLFENYAGYSIALVDKHGARFFTFHLGELLEHLGFTGSEVKHTKSGGASSLHGQRGGIAGQSKHGQQMIEKNMKEAAERASRFFEEQQTRRILLGGTEANVSLFKSQLPKAWQSLVLDTMTLDMTASAKEILQHVLRNCKDAELKREKRIVDSMISLAAKGGTAVTGLEPTIAAVNEERVRSLVMLEGFQFPGYVCKACNLLSVRLESSCPRCGSPMVTTDDVLELCVSNVMNTNGDVEIVHADQEIERAGQIGALLRY